MNADRAEIDSCDLWHHRLERLIHCVEAGCRSILRPLHQLAIANLFNNRPNKLQAVSIIYRSGRRLDTELGRDVVDLAPDVRCVSFGKGLGR